MRTRGLLRGMLVAAGGTFVLAAATGLAFAGWLEHAPAIFLALADAGMAWCF